MCRVISFSMSRVDSKLGPLFFKDNTTSTKSELTPAEAQAKIRSKKTSTTKGIQLLSLIIYTTVIPLNICKLRANWKQIHGIWKLFPRSWNIAYVSKVCAPVICCCALHFVDNVQSLHNAHFSFKKTAVNPTQISSENDTGSSMEEIEEDQSEPGGQKKKQDG